VECTFNSLVGAQVSHFNMGTPDKRPEFDRLAREGILQKKVFQARHTFNRNIIPKFTKSY
jgi:hypothetical protein